MSITVYPLLSLPNIHPASCNIEIPLCATLFKPVAVASYPFQASYKLSAFPINVAVSVILSILLPIIVTLDISWILSILLIALATSTALSILLPTLITCPAPDGTKGNTANTISTPNATQFFQSLYPPLTKSYIPQAINAASNT